MNSGPSTVISINSEMIGRCTACPQCTPVGAGCILISIVGSRYIRCHLPEYKSPGSFEDHEQESGQPISSLFDHDLQRRWQYIAYHVSITCVSILPWKSTWKEGTTGTYVSVWSSGINLKITWLAFIFSAKINSNHGSRYSSGVRIMDVLESWMPVSSARDATLSLPTCADVPNLQFPKAFEKNDVVVAHIHRYLQCL